MMLALSLHPCKAGAFAADELTVAAAADLTFAFKDVAAKFQAQNGDAMKLSFGFLGEFLFPDSKWRAL